MGRGSAVDTNDLMEVSDQGHLYGVALDVLDRNHYLYIIIYGIMAMLLLLHMLLVVMYGKVQTMFY